MVGCWVVDFVVLVVVGGFVAGGFGVWFVGGALWVFLGVVRLVFVGWFAVSLRVALVVCFCDVVVG